MLRAKGAASQLNHGTGTSIRGLLVRSCTVYKLRYVRIVNYQTDASVSLSDIISLKKIGRKKDEKSMVFIFDKHKNLKIF